MKRVAIISPGKLPIPASQGGAVETLVEYLLAENEIHTRLDLCVYSTFDSMAHAMTKKYSHTKFVFVKIGKITRIFNSIVSLLLRRFLKRDINDNRLYINKVISLMKKDYFDYVLIENRPEYVLPISRELNTRIILHLHNNHLNNSPNAIEIAGSCESILTVSSFIKNELREIDSTILRKTTVLTNCTDVNKFNKHLYTKFRNDYREAMNISSTDVVIGFFGRLNQTKGAKELLLAVKSIREPNIKVLIVGSSWYGVNEPSEYVKELMGISQGLNIIFTGYVNFADMPKYYSIADISVVPSIWDDPAPLVVLESLSSGLPLIATNSGGIPEYTTKDNTILIERDDNLIDNIKLSIELLVNNPRRIREMGSAARRHIEKFNTKRFYTDLLKVVGEDNEL